VPVLGAISGEEMELQRPGWRRDELCHQPLCDEIRRSILGQADTRAGRAETAACGAWVDPKRPRGLGERPLEHVAKDECAQVSATECVATDQIPESRTEEPAARYRISDDRRRLAIDLADAQERGDFGARELPCVFKAGDEALDNDIVRDCRRAHAARARRNPFKRSRERSAQAVEIGETDDLDDRGIAQKEA